MTNYIVAGEKSQVFHVHVEDFTADQLAAATELEGEELWDWLAAERPDVLVESMKRAVLAGVLSDFCHFVFEALCCSQKGKLTVTFALLRKPFKENLLMMEWLLADPEGFCTAFLTNSPHGVDLLGMKPTNREQIIREAVSLIGDGWITHDWLSAMRYERGIPDGFDALWNKATHLVTTMKAHATESQNLNFVFSGNDAWLDQWEHLYTLLPLMLHHAVEVVTELIRRIADVDENQLRQEWFRRMVGMMLWAESVVLHPDFVAAPGLEVLREQFASCNICCPECDRPMELSIDALHRVYAENVLPCSNCGLEVSLGSGDEEAE